MTNGSGFRDFYDNWLEYFEDVVKKPAPTKHDLWEGVTTRQQLEASPCWITVLPSLEPADHPFTTLLEQLWLEVETYKRLHNNVVSQNVNFLDVKGLFESAVQNCRKVEGRTHISSLKQVLRQYRSRLDRDLQRLFKIAEAHWKKSLQRYESELGHKHFVFVDPETQVVEDVNPEPIPASVKLLEEIQKNSKDETKLLKNMDLDGRFQRRLGRLLRHWLPKDAGIDLRTISCLIALIYLCADLAEERIVPIRNINRRKRKKGAKRKARRKRKTGSHTSGPSGPQLVIRQTNRVLGIDGVKQMLRKKAGLK